MQKWRTYIIVVILATIALPLHAQTSANVPTNDPAYEWIKILAGAGLVKTDFPEQLPWSRLEFVRLIREAESYYSKKFENNEDASESLKQYSKKFRQKYFIHQIMDALKAEFADVLDGQKSFHLEALNRAIIQYQYLGQDPQPAFSDGIGQTSGTVHPLVASPEGRHYLKGSNFDLQTQHWLQLSKYFTLMVRPQAELTSPATGNSQANIYLKTLAGKVGWKNIELEVGRDQVVWGISPHGGNLFSDNSRGLDQTQLNTPYPWHLPWKLKKLGEFKFATLFTNMGPQYSHANAWMTSTQLVWHITPNIRIGAAHQVTFGGSGITLPSAGTLFLEYLGVPTNTTSAAVNADNNRAYIGFGSLRLPFLRNTEFGLEWYLEDKNFSNAAALFHYQSAYNGWLFAPDLSGTGRWQASLNYNYVGPIPYRHGTYTSGWALNSEFIANTYGSDTQSLQTGIGYLISPYSKILTHFMYLRRLSSTYGGFTNAAGNLAGYTVLTHGPIESHYVGMLTFQTNLKHGLIMNLQGGIDFIQNAYFVPGKSINPGLFMANLSWYPYLRAQ